MNRHHDADFLVNDPMVTQKVAVKADRSADPFDYIDELRQEVLDAKGRDYRIYHEVRGVKQTVRDMNERLDDTGLNEIIDERMIGNVKTTASRWGSVFLRRALITLGAVAATGIAGGIAWVFKMTLRGIHAP